MGRIGALRAPSLEECALTEGIQHQVEELPGGPLGPSSHPARTISPVHRCFLRPGRDRGANPTAPMLPSIGASSRIPSRLPCDAPARAVALPRQGLEAGSRLQDRLLLVLVRKHLVWWLAGAQGDLGRLAVLLGAAEAMDDAMEAMPGGWRYTQALEATAACAESRSFSTRQRVSIQTSLCDTICDGTSASRLVDAAISSTVMKRRWSGTELATWARSIDQILSQ
jgi:hypothetical protein